MYGTIMRGKVKAGRKAEYEAMMRGMSPTPETGFHSAEVAWEDKDPDRFVVIVRFTDRDSYIANADSADTDAMYRQQLEFLEGEPEWIDVNYAEYMGKPIGEGASSTV